MSLLTYHLKICSNHCNLTAECRKIWSAKLQVGIFSRLVLSSFRSYVRLHPLVGVAVNVAAQQQLKRLGNAVVDGIVYIAAQVLLHFSSYRPPAETTSAGVSSVHVFRLDRLQDINPFIPPIDHPGLTNIVESGVVNGSPKATSTSG
jgi:hypothetical protein